MSVCDLKGPVAIAGASGAVRQAVESLEELPASITVVQKALDATDDAFCGNEELQHILSGDPGATADVLRVANSPYFGVSAQIRSLSMAIAVVGHARLRTLLRHLIVSKLLEKLTVNSVLARQARDRALAAGVACHEIAKKLRQPNPDDLLTGGLLYNVGEIALMSELPGGYEKVMDLARTMSPRVAEIAVFGVDSLAVSRWLLQAWDFPEIFVAAAGYWNVPHHPAVPPSLGAFVYSVHLGVCVAQGWLGKLGPEAVLRNLRGPESAWVDEHPGLLPGVYTRMETGIEKLSQSLLHVRAA
jgi:HD-like signal output (HDOD) protein